LRERYEIHHKLRYTDEALVAAAQLSYQYIRSDLAFQSNKQATVLVKC
jgi:ATP-dependent Clp protease ATP-binding subunit ClpA